MKKNKTILIIAILLLAVASYLLITQRTSTIRIELKDFAINDTASINKIFLADKFGNASTLVRESAAKWIVNGKYRARPDAINNLLSAMKLMEVRSPAGKAAYNTIMKDLAANAVKVEIYQRDKLIKTYYVGGATQDQVGTFMYLENSSVPFVIHIPGFDGYLTPRYITNEREWRMKNVFDSKIEEIISITNEDLEQPLNSFTILKQPDGNFQVMTYPDKKPVSGAEQNKVQNYLSEFTFINYEGEAGNNREQLDSIKSKGPFHILSLKDISNKTIRVKFYHAPVTEHTKGLLPFNEATGDKTPYDLDRMLAQINDEPGFVTVQYYVFGKFFKAPSDFMMSPPVTNKK
jgi:hypothetical protein